MEGWGKTIPSKPKSKYPWFRQKEYFYLDYIAVLEKLDELTENGLTPKQILDILNGK